MSFALTAVAVVLVYCAILCRAVHVATGRRASWGL